MSLGTKLLQSGILNFGPCAARGHPELGPVWRDDLPRACCICYKLDAVVSGGDYIRLAYTVTTVSARSDMDRNLSKRRYAKPLSDN